MSVALHNPLVLFASYIVPLIAGYVSCLRWGPNKGILYAIVPTLIVIAALFFFQVSAMNADGSGRLQVAFGYMLDESAFWFASFMVGAAIGSVQWRSRTRRG